VADWRQIQARIRKAKASDDPPGQLAALFEKTRDAMVAFEIAKLREKSGETQEAVRWYTTAAERFRRAEWRTKAAEALVRLGAPVPAPVSGLAEVERAAPEEAASPPESGAELTPRGGEQTHLPLEPPAAAEAEAGASAAAQAVPERRRRRRGRRGGRGRRRGGPPTRRDTSAAGVATGRAQIASRAAPEISRAAEVGEPPREIEERERAPARAAEAAAWTARGRAGEPALASRLAHLESQLRRLLASPLSRLDEAEQAPAGPGVFILSDSDLTTYYYVEACQTLRIGVANLLRAERGSRRGGGEPLRARFAEHLEITESRVAKYLKDHCAVRWIQLDEGAPALAHFAIAVLRPVLND
jgi:hypothetical protein